MNDVLKQPRTLCKAGQDLLGDPQTHPNQDLSDSDSDSHSDFHGKVKNRRLEQLAGHSLQESHSGALRLLCATMIRTTLESLYRQFGGFLSGP